MPTTPDIGLIPSVQTMTSPAHSTAQYRSRISVCHLASGDAWGGAEAQLMTLIRALSKRPDVEVYAIVLNDGRLADEIRACGIETKTIPERQTSFPRIVSQAREFLQGKHVNILHAHRYKENLIAALLALREPRIRIVKTQHGRPESLVGLAGLKQRLAHAIDRLTTRSAVDTVISVSSQLTGYLESYISRDRIAVIPNAIDLDHVRCDLSRTEAKQRLGIPEDSPVVGFVGRLEQVKRVDIFLNAAQQILRRLPNTKFVIAGTGREEQRVGNLIGELALRNNVILLGYREDTCAILRGMDLLLITSEHEGLPMVLLEAMALGTVVVAAKIGGIPEVLTDRQTGFLVEDQSPTTFASVCIEALEHPDLSQHVSQAARQLIESKHLAEHNAAKVVELYAALADTGARTEPPAIAGGPCWATKPSAAQAQQPTQHS
jgi:glycosyltransferase involved in cell wall biosynthesis